MGSSIKGSPGQSSVTIPPPLRGPMYGMSNWFGNQMPSLWGQPLPSYGGQLDHGLSPTQTQATRWMQDRARSPAPFIMGQGQATLGALMDPGMSGMRNPYSMSSSAGGGGDVMSQQGLQSSRDALLRYQNPSMALPRPPGSAGPPNFFPNPMSGGVGQPQQPQPPQGGGGPVPRAGSPSPFGMGGSHGQGGRGVGPQQGPMNLPMNLMGQAPGQYPQVPGYGPGHPLYDAQPPQGGQPVKSMPSSGLRAQPQPGMGLAASFMQQGQAQQINPFTWRPPQQQPGMGLAAGFQQPSLDPQTLEMLRASGKLF